MGSKMKIKLDTEIKLVDVVNYLVIIGILIYFVIQVSERNKFEFLNAQLRLKNCNLPDEMILPIIKSFVGGDYNVLDDIVKNSPEVSGG